MKHRLFWLCLALISFMMIDKAAASLHLKQNSTQLEPGSYALSEESYQIAKVTWLPDYLGKNKSYGKDRVNNNGKDVDNRDCANYGYVSSCGDGTGTVVHPIAGLTCYKDCKTSCSSLGYIDKCPSTQTGTAVTTEDGSTCYKDCKCSITYRYTTSSDLTPKMLGRVSFVNHCASPALVAGESCSQTYVNTTTSQTETAVLYKECNCPSQYSLATLQVDGDCTPCTNGDGVTKYACVANCNNYPLTVCPSGGICSPCPIDNSKLKLVSCDKENGWTMSTNEETCIKVENCNAYTLGSCPDGCNCSTCPDNNTKYKIDSAKTSDGWSWTSGQTTCSATACPAGYTAGVTECSGTNYYYSSNGKSGGLVCGLCKCNNTTDCSAYTLTSKSDANANYSSCSTGCGSAAKTTYKFESCKEGYELKSGKCEKIVTDCSSGGYSSSIPAGRVCTKVTYNGLTCYKDCLSSTLCAGNYVDSDEVMYTADNKAVGFKYSSKYYLLDVDGLYPNRHTGGQFSYCSNRNGELPSSSAMTSIIKTALDKFPDSANKTTLQGYAPWWTASSSGTYVKDGQVVSGGSCGTCVYCYANSEGHCYSYESAKHCSDKSDNRCILADIPYTLCIAVCSNSSIECPSGTVRSGQCPTDTEQGDLSTTLESGTKCYKCNDTICRAPKVEEGKCSGIATYSNTLVNGKKCYDCNPAETFTLEASYTVNGSCSNGRFVDYRINVQFFSSDGNEILSSASLSLSNYPGSKSTPFDRPVPVNTPLKVGVSHHNEGTTSNPCSATIKGITVNGQSVSFGASSSIPITLSSAKEKKVKFNLNFY